MYKGTVAGLAIQDARAEAVGQPAAGQVVAGCSQVADHMQAAARDIVAADKH